MTEHRRALPRTQPVAAGAVGARRKGGAVGLRSSEDVVAVRVVAAPVVDVALLRERGPLGQLVARAVEIGDVLGDHDALGILPRPLADAIARVRGARALGLLGREIGAPCLFTGACGLRELLAMAVGPSEPAEIAALAGAGRGDE